MIRDEKSKNLDLKYFFSVVISILIIISLTRMIWDNLEGLRRVKTLRSDTQLLEEENTKLKEKIEERQSLDYVEEEARRKIGMVKEGEKVLIYPDDPQENESTQEVTYMEGNLCYWCEWLNAFGF